ncbi:MAG: hypothetical protein P4L43_08750 [Syntrophobacteraceae bacterium]|nr:hypothetical protein [Syntrophobacteraceae bacterium]
MTETHDLEKIKVKVSDEVKALLEKRHVLDYDIRQVIEHAERSGEKFLNPGSGRFLASFKPKGVTYWVEYTAEGGEFRVYNAYSHRMEVR